MSSRSEETFGARLANARKIGVQLSAAAGYQPPVPDLGPAALADLISSLEGANNSIAALTAAWSAAVEARQQAFRKQPDSVYRLLSPIYAAVRAAYGKDSKEAADMAGMIRQIRGVRLKKAAAGAEEKAVSQSEASYGSMIRAFAGIVATLQSYSAYNPATAGLKTGSLQAKVAELTAVGNAVTAAYSRLKPARDARAAGYKALTARVQRIKDAVKSQYGNRSSEYVQVKGLKV